MLKRLLNQFSTHRLEAVALAGLILALSAAGCGDDQAACHLCQIDLNNASDATWTFENVPYNSGLGAPLWPGSPIQFVVYADSSRRQVVPGAEVDLYTIGSALALVEDDRLTVRAVDGPLSRIWVSMLFLLDFAATDLPPTTGDNNRGIWRARADDHGRVSVIPAGYVAGCPAMPVGTADLVIGGAIGVGAQISNDRAEWGAKWIVTCTY
ncbi:MAG: hypothetical protein OEY97_10030 [Nitrospirota bacterium]|nr:hypothetical protein [Nitrospirota bacterium]